MRHDLSRLSNRESQILRLMANGLTKEAIATHLSLTERTIGGHQQNIIKKFSLQDEAELLRLVKAVFL